MYYYTIVIIARLKHEYFIYIAESLENVTCINFEIGGNVNRRSILRIAIV